MTALRAIKPAPPAASPRDDLLFELIAAQALNALSQELEAWPKPGLVSHVD